MVNAFLLFLFQADTDFVDGWYNDAWTETRQAALKASWVGSEASRRKVEWAAYWFSQTSHRSSVCDTCIGQSPIVPLTYHIPHTT